MSDAKNRTNTVTMETGPYTCERCKQPISPFIVEDIEGITQMRAGKALILRIEASCLTPGCGCIFRWNIRERDVEKMTVTYEKVLGNIQRYNPE